MYRMAPKLRGRFVVLTSGVSFALLFLALFLTSDPPASALPPPGGTVRAIPAFARKYGMPCSSCHEAWPMLSPFGQAFKDNGYQLGNDRDAPFFNSRHIGRSPSASLRSGTARTKIGRRWMDRPGHQAMKATSPLTDSTGAGWTFTPAARSRKTSPSTCCLPRTTPEPFTLKRCLLGWTISLAPVG